MEGNKSKLARSDRKFLNRPVFVLFGEITDITTVKEIIEARGIYYFRSRFIDGYHEYRVVEDWRMQEVYFEPHVIYDARSGKAVSAIGALRVYDRECRGGALFHVYRWHGCGFRPSRRNRYRRIATFSSIRSANAYWEDEGEMPFAAKVRDLPSNRDGMYNFALQDKSWKRFRKTQYK